MKPLHIAIGSTLSLPGDVPGNLEKIAAMTKQAATEGADILLTPELSASGYGAYPEVLATAEPAGGGNIYQGLASTSEEYGVVICAGFVEQAAGKNHLAHYAVWPDGKFVVQRKHRVTLAEHPLEPSVELTGHPAEGAADPADPGQPLELQFEYFTVKGARCVLSICADNGIDGVNRVWAENGVEIILAPAGAGGRREDRVVTTDLYTEEGREKYYKMLEQVFFPGRSVVDCIRHRTAKAAVNLCGYDGRGQYHLGHGSIITPLGEVAGFFHGLPNLDRQRAMFAHAVVDLEDKLS